MDFQSDIAARLQPVQDLDVMLGTGNFSEANMLSCLSKPFWFTHAVSPFTARYTASSK